ncbi:MAG: DUF2269 family protein [Deltaproteobacteria bacterium]|nr:DUF2269 family protein [Deltaproteobacteria bacterium]
MKTKPLLVFTISLMLALIGWVQFFPGPFFRVVDRLESYPDLKFLHIFTVTLFYANAVIGTLWEARGLLSRDLPIIRHTYRTVTFLDATFTAPLILVAAFSGILLARLYGGIWTIGWVSTALTLFLGSGIFWRVADIPTQYRVRRAFERVPVDVTEVPSELQRLLWLRLAINIASLLPLTVVFYLMVHKPEMRTVGRVLGWP